LRKEDFLLHIKALAPNNTQNFFGRGNGTLFDKTGNYKRYYRTRFSLYEITPSIRWHIGKRDNLTAGPSIQYYHYDKSNNVGRFITVNEKIGSYDSATIANDKSHAGIIATFIHDSRDNILLPTYGSYINTSIQGYNGLNTYSKGFAQITAEMSVYKSVDRKSILVIANRTGAGVNAGKTTFYQSQFLGGQENLLGYRQYRFAGEQMLYNNLEARMKLADVVSGILPGQLGIIGFYDVGKVWQKGNNNNTWHQGIGGGLFFAPANIAVFQFVLANSSEGTYPYFKMGFRF
jgi:outer membrane translocation and assembly module TamA